MSSASKIFAGQENGAVEVSPADESVIGVELGEAQRRCMAGGYSAKVAARDRRASRRRRIAWHPVGLDLGVVGFEPDGVERGASAPGEKPGGPVSARRARPGPSTGRCDRGDDEDGLEGSLA